MSARAKTAKIRTIIKARCPTVSVTMTSGKFMKITSVFYGLARTVEASTDSIEKTTDLKFIKKIPKTHTV